MTRTQNPLNLEELKPQRNYGSFSLQLGAMPKGATPILYSSTIWVNHPDRSAADFLSPGQAHITRNGPNSGTSRANSPQPR